MMPNPVGIACIELQAHLEVISGDLRWCFADAYQPRRATGSGSSTTSDAQAPRWDIGQGSYGARRSFKQACRWLCLAEARTAAVLWAARIAQPSLAEPDGTALRPALVCVDSLSARVRLIDQGQEALQDVPRRSLDYPSWLWGRPADGRPNAVEAAYRARTALHRALPSPGPDQAPTGWCFVCGIRAVPSGKQARCSTCRQYRARTGRERPTALDAGKGNVMDARRTSARHKAMGEGYGYD